MAKLVFTMPNLSVPKNSKDHHLDIVDVSRGFAILLMFVYHFFYDLNYYGFIEENFNHDPFWLNFRTLIVTLFLTIVGMSLYLSSHQGIRAKSVKRRLILLVAYSSLVSLGSWLMFPKQMIFFGILHFITLASIIGLMFVRLGLFNLFLGIFLIIFANVFSNEIFNHSFLNWIGLTTQLPNTVDYVPLLPWIGVVFIGIYLGQLITTHQSKLNVWKTTHPSTNLLALAGRNSLNIYMLHQPIFLGILYGVKVIVG